MTRYLYILRHAKSDWSTDAANDFERPLAKRGRLAAASMGEWMANRQVLPALVVSSPATRAKQTVHIVADSIGYDKDRIAWEPRIYDAELSTLLEVVSQFDEDPASVMIVGHNPGFDNVVRHLAGENLGTHDRPKLMPTAALAALAMPDSWGSLSRGCATVDFITRPREIENG